ncbi:MAG: sporulation protein YqfD [Lachnospiraceae bacterium]|nr:sporulation protein YqfD [Lachnospiraceae bacterium]
MQHFTRSMTGYVTIRVHGKDAERFLNLCAARKIILNQLVENQGYYSMNLCVSDYKKLQPICRKTNCKVHILSKHGLPFFFYRNRKRKAFFAGFFLFLLLQLFLSGFIWNIHITGNQINSTRTLLTFLEQKGVYHGMRKERVSCAEIASEIRAGFSDVIWVSSKVEGTQLVLQIKENMEKKDPETAGDTPQKQPCSLAAKKEGRIIKMITRSGKPLTTAGSLCKEGDILVSGEIPIMNDSGEVVHYEKVAADADILLATKIYYYKEFSRKVQRKKYTGEHSKRYFFQVGGFRLLFPAGDPSGLWQSQKEEQHQLFLTENYALPFYYGSVTTDSYVKIPVYYEEEEAKAKAKQLLTLFCDELEKKGVQISEKNVKINLTDATCITKGYLSVLEQAVTEVPCEPTAGAVGKDETSHEQ